MGTLVSEHLRTPSHSLPASTRHRLLAAPLGDLMAEARALRPGPLVTYSPKVFIPLTTLCRDVCGYCTFARPPRRGERAFMTEDEVLAIARRGVAAGCTEALFTLGDKPELRYKTARDELATLGYGTTIEYLAHCARRVLDETGLLPHLNPGVMTAGSSRCYGRSRPRWASCSRPCPTACRGKEAPTGPLPTRCRRAGSRRSGPPVSSRSPSRAAS